MGLIIFYLKNWIIYSNTELSIVNDKQSIATRINDCMTWNCIMYYVFALIILI